jgi:hypothetical protein
MITLSAIRASKSHRSGVSVSVRDTPRRSFPPLHSWKPRRDLCPFSSHPLGNLGALFSLIFMSEVLSLCVSVSPPREIGLVIDQPAHYLVIARSGADRHRDLEPTSSCLSDVTSVGRGSWVACTELITFFVRFKVFTAVTMKNAVFWDVTPCGSCKNRRLGGT